MAVIFKSTPAFIVKLSVGSDSPSCTPLFFGIQGTGYLIPGACGNKASSVIGA